MLKHGTSASEESHSKSDTELWRSCADAAWSHESRWIAFTKPAPRLVGNLRLQ